MRMLRSCCLFVLGLGMFLSASNLGFAQSGDGSYSSNPELYGSGGYFSGDKARYETGTAHGLISVPQEPLSSEAAQAYMEGAELEAVPREPFHPFFDVDWSVGLSLTHTGGTETGKNAVTLAPQISVAHIGLRNQYAFDMQAELWVNDNQLTRLDQVNVSYSGQYSVDNATRLYANAGVALSQDDVNGPGIASNIEQTPVVLNLTSELGLVRQFGRFSVDGKVQAERLMQSDTMLIGGAVQNNGERNLVKLGGVLRTSYEFTPEVSLFVETGFAHDWYDSAPVLTGIKSNGWDENISAGAAVNWRDVLSGELSVGYGVRRFDDASLGEMGTGIFGLNLAYTPNEALSAGAEFTTTLTPADVGAGRVASVDYAAAVNLGYLLTPQLGLRASLSGNWVRPTSGSNTHTTYSAGTGVDFSLNKNIMLNADYLYTWAEILPAPARYQHAGTIGVRVSR